MKTLIIAIVYLEPSWQETKECLQKCNNRVVLVDRDGVGSLAGAYNYGFKEYADSYKYVWFVSNVKFDPLIVEQLEQAMEDNPGFATIHPVMNNSDHHHMRYSKFMQRMYGESGILKEVPFVEFTAPIVRADVFRNIMLHEELKYVGHDMAWGYDVRQAGYKIGVLSTCEVDHTYLRHSPDHPITRERMRLRRESDKQTIEFLIEKYGKDYKQKLKYFNKLES